MVYVARFTLDPQDDIERGWSGFMGVAFNTLRNAAKTFLDIDTEELDAADEDQLESMLDDAGYDIRFDKKLGLYRHVHHTGLSCFALNAETLEDALVESHPDAIGEGWYTIGKVTYVCPVPNDDGWHIFECQHVGRE